MRNPSPSFFYLATTSVYLLECRGVTKRPYLISSLAYWE